MAAKKMIPPHAIENDFGDDYDEFKLGISFRLQGGQVVMQFSDSVDRARMTAGALESWRRGLPKRQQNWNRFGTPAASGIKAGPLKATGLQS